MIDNTSVKEKYCWTLKKSKDLQLKYPKIHIGGFTRVDGGEKDIIFKHWESLIKNFNISDPKQLQDELKSIKNIRITQNLFKIFVIGAYLSQQLPYLRHPTNVFEYAIDNVICQKYKSGSYTSDEDAIILSELSLHGDSSKTFTKLSLLLNRQTNLIKQRASILLNKGDKPKEGYWNLNDNQILIDNQLPPLDNQQFSALTDDDYLPALSSSLGC